MATQVRLLVEGGAPKGGMDLGSGTELPAEIRRLLQDSKEATQEEEEKKVKKNMCSLCFFPANVTCHTCKAGKVVQICLGAGGGRGGGGCGGGGPGAR